MFLSLAAHSLCVVSVILMTRLLNSQRQEVEVEPGEAKQPQLQQQPASTPFVAVALDKNRPAWMARQDNVLLM